MQTTVSEPAQRVGSALAPRSFRDVLGRFATGVVVVTAATPDGPAGMTVNSFTSVSLEPRLVALCAAFSSTTWPHIRATGGFAVSVLGSWHEDLCRLFSTRGADRFAGREWARTRAGHPVLADGLAWLDCRISTIHPAGDHEMVIAEVLDGGVSGHGDPLVFHAGRFTSLPAALPCRPRPADGQPSQTGGPRAADQRPRRPTGSQSPPGSDHASLTGDQPRPTNDPGERA